MKQFVQHKSHMKCNRAALNAFIPLRCHDIKTCQVYVDEIKLRASFIIATHLLHVLSDYFKTRIYNVVL